MHHKSNNSPVSQWSETAGSRAEPVHRCCHCKQIQLYWKKLIRTDDGCASKVNLGYLTLICVF